MLAQYCLCIDRIGRLTRFQPFQRLFLSRVCPTPAACFRLLALGMVTPMLSWRVPRSRQDGQDLLLTHALSRRTPTFAGAGKPCPSGPSCNLNDPNRDPYCIGASDGNCIAKYVCPGADLDGALFPYSKQCLPVTKSPDFICNAAAAELPCQADAKCTILPGDALLVQGGQNVGCPQRGNIPASDEKQCRAAAGKAFLEGAVRRSFRSRSSLSGI